MSHLMLVRVPVLLLLLGLGLGLGVPASAIAQDDLSGGSGDSFDSPEFDPNAEPVIVPTYESATAENTSTETATSEDATQVTEAKSDEPAKEPSVVDSINDTFGSITGVFWTKFLGYPLFTTTTVPVFITDKNQLEEVKSALNKANIPAWDAEGDTEYDHKIFVAKSDQEAAKKVIRDSGRSPFMNAKEETGSHGGFPFIVVVLIFGGVFFTFRFMFVNIRLFPHCINIVRGKYDDPNDEGEISSFQALTSALSATVGLGNIAGVAVAISMGGAGAVFWMWAVAFIGMSTKFSSCAFSQIYRRVKPDGHILGGPMVYLEEGFKEQFPSIAPVGKVLAVVFAICTIGGSLGGGNMFQSNQTYDMVAYQFGMVTGNGDLLWRIIVGLGLATAAGLVILGGIKRIGEVTSKLVPFMCGFYCIVCLTIIISNIGSVGTMFAEIFSKAFTGEAAFGGFMGVLVMGARRAAFSNEAGLGSSAIAHSAAKTDEPVREGVVGMVEPFIDTIVVCTMTALTILITGAHLQDISGEAISSAGVAITATAFKSLSPHLTFLLMIAVATFAFSTVISWSYYGERATEYLVGQAGILPYRILYVCVIAIGPLLTLGNVIDFSDLMLLSMAFPNIIGMIILSSKLKGMTDDYCKRLKSGEMDS